MAKIYLGTVALEINRWSSREPSYLVSQWIEKIKTAGFDGLELWENHVLRSPGEAEKIRASGLKVAIYNHYGTFSSSPDDVEKRKAAAQMVSLLGAGAVKYNVGSAPELTAQYKENVLAFADELPKDCVLLCECHAGTVLEANDAAEPFFDGLSPEKFGLILHPFASPGELTEKFKRFGSRIAHIHSQLTMPDGCRHCLEDWPERVLDAFDIMKSNGFKGNFTIEFTGLTASPDENIDGLFSNAVKDLGYIKETYLRSVT